MGIKKSIEYRIKIIKCKTCENEMRTTKNAGYVFCHRCGDNTRIEKYKRFAYSQEDPAHKVDKKWVFRDD